MEETVIGKTVNEAQTLASESAVRTLDLARSFLTAHNIVKFIGAIIVLALIWIVWRFAARAVKKMQSDKVSMQRKMIAKKIVDYAFAVIMIVYVLGLFGVKLSALWGAAGIAGIALGFAAQTSASNLISGIFVLSEGIMKVGDYVSVGGEIGTVDSIGLLSIKIHTADNELVRIPNSTVINANLTNFSFFKERRMKIEISVSYSDDMQKAFDALLRAAKLCKSVLENPAPAVWFESFGNSGINMTLAIFFKQGDFFAAKNEAFIAIKKTFDETGITVPFTTITLDGGNAVSQKK